MGFRFCLSVFLGGAVAVLATDAAVAKDKGPVAQKETVIASLTKEQVAEFSGYVHNKDLRREELIVSDRLLVEKQGELKGLMEEMSKEFGISPDKSYTFEKETKSLYLLSTNQVDKAGKPARTLLRQMKTDGEAQYLSRLMIARRMTEQQIFVLAQIREEKSKECGLIDAKLRQAFKLDPQTSYRLDEKTGQLIRLDVPQTAGADAAKDAQAKSGAAVGSGKNSTKKK